MGTHALALCLGLRSACASQRCKPPVSQTATAAAVALQSPVPLRRPHLVPAPTTLSVHQITNELVCSPSVQLSAASDGALCQGTQRTATGLHKHGVVSPVDGEDDGVWAEELWCGTRRTATVTGSGVPATMIGVGAGANVLQMRVRKMGVCSTIPGQPGPRTKCGTVRQARTVIQVHGAWHGVTGLTMQRIAMQAQMMPPCWSVWVVGGGSGKWLLEHEQPFYAVRFDQAMAERRDFIWNQSRNKGLGVGSASPHSVCSQIDGGDTQGKLCHPDLTCQWGWWWYLIVVSCFFYCLHHGQ